MVSWRVSCKYRHCHVKEHTSARKSYRTLHRGLYGYSVADEDAHKDYISPQGAHAAASSKVYVIRTEVSTVAHYDFHFHIPFGL